MISMERFNQDSEQLRPVFGCFPSGVVAIAAQVEGEPVGMVASTFTSVSMDPALVSICMQNTSGTWPRLRDCPTLGLSLLAEGHDTACISLSSKHGDRFAGVEWDVSGAGSVFLNGSVAWLDCRLHVEVPAGDHLIVLFEIVGLRADPTLSPLVYHGSRFHRLASLEPARV